MCVYTSFNRLKSDAFNASMEFLIFDFRNFLN
jgi:hypothetical protein